MPNIRTLCAIAIPSLAAAPAFAQQAVEPDRWEFTLAPYFLAPYMNGEQTVRGRTVSLDASPGDVFEKLQFGAMLYFEARGGPWAIAADGLYMDLAQSAERTDAEAGAKQGAVELVGFRRVAPAVEVLVGGRVNVLDASIEFPAPDATVGETKTWLDPIVGARLGVPGDSRWIAALRADIGGFGLGSDLAWQIYPVVGYRFNEWFSLVGAFRVLDTKYETGEGVEQFVYDVTTFGPELGLAFHF